MHLSQRGGGKGLLVEFFENFFRRLAQLFTDDLSRLRGSKRRHRSLKLRKLPGIFLTNKIGAERKHLPELHERRPEPFHSFPNAHLRRLFQMRPSFDREGSTQTRSQRQDPLKLQISQKGVEPGDPKFDDNLAQPPQVTGTLFYGSHDLVGGAVQITRTGSSSCEKIILRSPPLYDSLIFLPMRVAKRFSVVRMRRHGPFSSILMICS